MLQRIYKSKIDGSEQLSRVPSMYCDVTELVFDTETKIIYYKFYEQTPNVRINDHVGFMSPYLGSHGRPCRFIDCEIKEISKDE